MLQDLANVAECTARLVSLGQFRAGLHEYLNSKMHAVAPNLAGTCLSCLLIGLLPVLYSSGCISLAFMYSRIHVLNLVTFACSVDRGGRGRSPHQPRRVPHVSVL